MASNFLTPAETSQSTGLGSTAPLPSAPTSTTSTVAPAPSAPMDEAQRQQIMDAGYNPDDPKDMAELAEMKQAPKSSVGERLGALGLGAANAVTLGGLNKVPQWLGITKDPEWLMKAAGANNPQYGSELADEFNGGQIVGSFLPGPGVLGTVGKGLEATGKIGEAFVKGLRGLKEAEEAEKVTQAATPTAFQRLTGALTGSGVNPATASTFRQGLRGAVTAGTDQAVRNAMALPGQSSGLGGIGIAAATGGLVSGAATRAGKFSNQMEPGESFTAQPGSLGQTGIDLEREALANGTGLPLSRPLRQAVGINATIAQENKAIHDAYQFMASQGATDSKDIQQVMQRTSTVWKDADQAYNGEVLNGKVQFTPPITKEGEAFTPPPQGEDWALPNTPPRTNPQLGDEDAFLAANTTKQGIAPIYERIQNDPAIQQFLAANPQLGPEMLESQLIKMDSVARSDPAKAFDNQRATLQQQYEAYANATANIHEGTVLKEFTPVLASIKKHMDEYAQDVLTMKAGGPSAVAEPGGMTFAQAKEAYGYQRLLAAQVARQAMINPKMFTSGSDTVSNLLFAGIGSLGGPGAYTLAALAPTVKNAIMKAGNRLAGNAVGPIGSGLTKLAQTPAIAGIAKSGVGNTLIRGAPTLGRMAGEGAAAATNPALQPQEAQTNTPIPNEFANSLPSLTTPQATTTAIPQGVNTPQPPVAPLQRTAGTSTTAANLPPGTNADVNAASNRIAGKLGYNVMQQPTETGAAGASQPSSFRLDPQVAKMISNPQTVVEQRLMSGIRAEYTRDPQATTLFGPADPRNPGYQEYVQARLQSLLTNGKPDPYKMSKLLVPEKDQPLFEAWQRANQNLAAAAPGALQGFHPVKGFLDLKSSGARNQMISQVGNAVEQAGGDSKAAEAEASRMLNWQQQDPKQAFQKLQEIILRYAPRMAQVVQEAGQ